MADPDWQLWGTFSVVDHLRPESFVSDVLVYDRLLVPVPPDRAVDAWQQAGWEPDKQRAILDILKDGNPRRVEEIEWGGGLREEYHSQIIGLRSRLAAGAAADMSAIQATPGDQEQYATRMVLVGYRKEQPDQALIPGIPPPDPVDIVAAYGSEEEFTAETGATPADNPAAPHDLLGAFAWPFAVPANADAELDALKRAVEYANQPEVQQYRQAFHRWRGRMVREGRSPAAAAADLQGEIDCYANWARVQDHAKIIRCACAVAGVGVGLAAALLPVIGMDIPAAAAGAAAVGTPFLGPAATRLFTGRLQTYNPAASPGALFWEAQHFG